MRAVVVEIRERERERGNADPLHPISKSGIPVAATKDGRHTQPCQIKTRILAMEAPMLGFDRITFDPNILGGKACIRGMRISVSLIVNLVANGMTVAEILTEYPNLEEEDVAQALRYAAWASDDVFIPATETA